MAKPDPFEFQRDRMQMERMRVALEKAAKPPFGRLTQGGSSRKGHPARVAAVDANTYRNNPTGAGNA